MQYQRHLNLHSLKTSDIKLFSYMYEALCFNLLRSIFSISLGYELVVLSISQVVAVHITNLSPTGTLSKENNITNLCLRCSGTSINYTEPGMDAHA